METINLNQSGIYAIVSPNGKLYIGSSLNILGRWHTHKHQLKNGKHHCIALQRAYIKYEGNLKFQVVEFCPKNDLLAREQSYMDSAPSGCLYNSARTAGRPQLGLKLSEETRKKIGDSLRGQVRGQYTADHKAKISRANRGKTPSAETRAKLSAAGKGRVVSAETRAKLTGRKASPETLAKLRGRLVSEETREKLRSLVHSEESRLKMSKSRTGLKYANNKSGYVGVCLNKRLNKWGASAKIRGKQIYLGTYPTAELAHQARSNFDRVLAYY